MPQQPAWDPKRARRVCSLVWPSETPRKKRIRPPRLNLIARAKHPSMVTIDAHAAHACSCVCARCACVCVRAVMMGVVGEGKGSVGRRRNGSRVRNSRTRRCWGPWGGLALVSARVL